MDEYRYELKIPKERVAVLIGTAGKIKKELEAQTDARIHVDSAEGDVTVTGSNSVNLFALRDIVLAIGRGFSPEKAQLLLKGDYALEVLSMAAYAKGKTHQVRLKGRIIGADGKARRTIEQLTGAYLCVYGKTVSVLGPVANVALARRAVEGLLSGNTHAAVYKFLEKARRDAKAKGLL